MKALVNVLQTTFMAVVVLGFYLVVFGTPVLLFIWLCQQVFS